MTNYEWLVKERKLEDFLYDIINWECATSEKRFEELAEVIADNYKLYLKEERSYGEQHISSWLQAERKGPEQYVKLSEVYDAFRGIMVPLKGGIGSKQNKACMDAIREVVAEAHKRIAKLEVKELNDEKKS